MENNKNSFGIAKKTPAKVYLKDGGKGQRTHTSIPILHSDNRTNPTVADTGLAAVPNLLRPHYRSWDSYTLTFSTFLKWGAASDHLWPIKWKPSQLGRRAFWESFSLFWWKGMGIANIALPTPSAFPPLSVFYADRNTGGTVIIWKLRANTQEGEAKTTAKHRPWHCWDVKQCQDRLPPAFWQKKDKPLLFEPQKLGFQFFAAKSIPNWETILNGTPNLRPAYICAFWVRLNPHISYQSPETLPEEDQVLFLLMISKEMYQLIKFLIGLTHLQSKKETFNKNKFIDNNHPHRYFHCQP